MIRLGAYALIRRERKDLNSRVTDFGKRLVGDQFGVRLGSDRCDELRAS
jgi:hypothetical protein